MSERRYWVKITEGETKPLVGLRRRIEPIKPQSVTFEAALQRYKEAWDANELTPELVNRTWQLFWRDREKAAGLDRELVVPTCDRTTQELAALREQKRGVVLLPHELMDRQGFSLVVNLVGMDVTNLSKTKVITNTSNQGGCIDIELDSEAPHQNRTAARWGQILKSENRTGQRLQTYIVGSFFNHLLTGNYFDEEGQTVLLGTKGSYGNFSADSKMFTTSWRPSYYQGSNLWGRAGGLRSEGRKT